MLIIYLNKVLTLSSFGIVFIFTLLLFGFYLSKIKPAIINNITEINKSAEKYRLLLMIMSVFMPLSEFIFYYFSIRNFSSFLLNLALGLFCIASVLISKKIKLVEQYLYLFSELFFTIYLCFIFYSMYNSPNELAIIAEFTMLSIFSYYTYHSVKKYIVSVIFSFIVIVFYYSFGILNFVQLVIYNNVILLSLGINYCKYLIDRRVFLNFETSTKIMNESIFITILFDKSGIVTYASNNCKKLLGIESNNINGKNINMLFDINIEDLLKLNNTEIEITKELKTQHKGKLYFQWNVSTTKYDSYCMIGNNITANYLLRKSVTKSKNRLEVLLSNAGEIIFVANEKLVITEYYKKESTQLDVENAQFVGKTIDEIGFDLQTLDAIKTAVNNTLQTNSTVQIEYSLSFQDDISWFEISITPFKDKDESQHELLYVIRNITEIKLLKQKQINQKSIAELRNKLIIQLSLNSINIHKTQNELLHAITEAIGKGINADRISIWKYHTDYIECEDLYSKDKNLHSSGVQLFKKDFPIYFNTISSGNIIMANDAYTHESTKEFAKSYLTSLQIKSMMDLPIFIAGDLYGIICCECSTENLTWTEEDSTFVRLVSDILAVYIEANRRIEAEKKLVKTKILLGQSNAVAKIGAWELNLTSNEIEWSENARAIFEIDSTEDIEHPIGLCCINSIKEKEKFTALFDLLIKQNQSFDEEVLITTKANNEVWIRIIAQTDNQQNASIAFGAFQNIHEQVMSRKALAKSELNFKQINDTIQDVFWLWKIEENKMEYINSSCLNIFGYVEDDFYYDSLLWHKFILKEDIQLVVDAHKFLLANQFYEVEYRVLTKNNEIKWVLEKSFAIVDDDLVIRKSSGLSMDITKQKNLALDRRKNKEKEFENKSKSQFIANMSHEIRTPLNSVIGLADMLSNTNLSKQQSEYVAIINHSANLLLDLVNNMLDLSKMNAGKLFLKNHTTNIITLCNELYVIIKFNTTQKGIKFVIDIDDAIYPTILLDSLSFKQVLLNLLGNAVKFTKEGSVTLKLHLLLMDSTSQTIRFSIIDTGIGIKEENQKNIFDPFIQEDISFTKKYEGTGLGLTISSKIITLMGSKLRLESELGKGSTFYFDLKLDLDTNSNNQENATLAPTEINIEKNKSNEEAFNLKNYKILIVEDNSLNQFLIKAIINSILPSTILYEAVNGEEAITMFSKYLPDLIFMDIQMPILDGYSASKQIRELPNGKQVPIIAITAGSIENEREYCIQAGMNDFLRKPITKNYIQNALLTWLIKKEDQQLSDDTQVNNHFDILELQKTVNENQSFLKSIFPYLKESLEDGVLELNQHLANKDLKSICRVAHKIKGSSLTACCTKLTTLAQALENQTEYDDKIINKMIDEINDEIKIILASF
jgi:signal transduction histidine kinase/CheY-like chemotaxis protein/HPt (histidine-containing phosphotransfer) domain-containing protein